MASHRFGDRGIVTDAVVPVAALDPNRSLSSVLPIVFDDLPDMRVAPTATRRPVSTRTLSTRRAGWYPTSRRSGSPVGGPMRPTPSHPVRWFGGTLAALTGVMVIGGYTLG